MTKGTLKEKDTALVFQMGLTAKMIIPEYVRAFFQRHKKKRHNGKKDQHVVYKGEFKFKILLFSCQQVTKVNEREA